MLKLFRLIRYLFRQRRVEAELAEEIEFHRAQKQKRLEQSGMAADEAAYATRRALGNVMLAREDARAVWIAPWLAGPARCQHQANDFGRPRAKRHAMGTAGAVAVSRLLQGSLYGLSPVDPVANGGVALLLAVAGIGATFVPARRAAHVDPLNSLRAE